tara:strand:- start:15 stop:290 length:276 start_codon:yes stop_codon:yes gene_type:complete
MKNANRLIFQTIRALQDRSIDKDEAVELMRGGSLLCLELKPHTRTWWAKRALDIAAITLQEQSELLKSSEPQKAKSQDTPGNEDTREIKNG